MELQNMERDQGKEQRTGGETVGQQQPLVTMASVHLKQKCTLKRLLRDAKGPSQRDGRKSQSSRGKDREQAGCKVVS